MRIFEAFFRFEITHKPLNLFQFTLGTKIVTGTLLICLQYLWFCSTKEGLSREGLFSNCLVAGKTTAT